MADALSFDDLVPDAEAAPQAQPAAFAGLTPEQLAYAQNAAKARPDLTPEQLAYAAKAATARDPAAAEGSPANPSYDRPGYTGDPALSHVTAEGGLSAPAGQGLGFDDLVPKASPVEDAARSFGSGLAHGTADAVDFVGSALPGLNVLERATSGGNPLVPDPLHTTGHFARKVVDAFGPKTDYQPQTTAGRYAETIGEFAPAAAMGGEGIAGRAANALLPAVASQAAGDAAHAMGASPGVEKAARVAGAFAGAGGASVRVDPAAALSRAEGNAGTLGRLEAQKTAAYKAVDEAGITFTPQAFRDLAGRIAQAMDEAGFSAGLHPKASAMVADIGSTMRSAPEYAPTLSDVDKLRQQVGRDVASSRDPGDQRMGTIMRQTIDQFVSGIGPQDVMGAADPAHAAGLLSTARDLNTRVIKLRDLDNLDEAAVDRAATQGVGANRQGASRQNMRRFQDSTGNLSPDEQAAVRRSIRGTAPQNALRYFGALSPDRGPLGLLTTLGAAAGTGGHSVPLSIAAMIARHGSDAMQEANVQAVRDLIASGGDRSALDLSQNALTPRRRFITMPETPALDQGAPAAMLSYQSQPAETPPPR